MLYRIKRYLNWRRRDRADRAALSIFRTGDPVHLADSYWRQVTNTPPETVCLLRLSQDVSEMNRHPEDKLYTYNKGWGYNMAYVWVPGYHSSTDRGIGCRVGDFTLVGGPW